MLDKTFIERKIALINEELMRLKKFEHETLDDLARDWSAQASAERLLERVFMRAIDINEHIIGECGAHLPFPRRYRETFLRLADLGIYSLVFAQVMGENAVLRNALVHEYNELDPAIRQKSVGQLIKEFNHYIQFISAFIEKQNKE